LARGPHTVANVPSSAKFFSPWPKPLATPLTLTMDFSNFSNHCCSLLMLPFTQQYKTAWLTAISSHCLAEFPAKMYYLRSTVTCNKTPTTVTWSQALRFCCYIIIGEVAGKFLGVRRNFAGILLNLPEKYFKKSDLQEKCSCQFERCFFFKSKHAGRHFGSDLQGVLEGSQGFCPDFTGFCPDFHQIKTLGCDCTPASCTSACYCYTLKANSRKKGRTFRNLPPQAKEWTWVSCKLATAWHLNREPGSCAVWASYRQTNCHCKN